MQITEKLKTFLDFFILQANIPFSFVLTLLDNSGVCVKSELSNKDSLLSDLLYNSHIFNCFELFDKDDNHLLTVRRLFNNRYDIII